jgi:23S rRNA (uridine2552-2'-O)-methyltransferase
VSRRGGTPPTTARGKAVRVKTAKKRSASSTQWLQRQLNDPYVAEAKRRGYRSRAAFKLEQLDDRFHLLKPGARVVDLGCAPGRLKAALGGPADVVLSDMAAPTTGHGATDHLRIVALAEAAFAFAEEVLAPGGTFVAKVFQGGAEGDLLASLKRQFASVRHAKPAASRAESAETYVVAQGFRGAPAQ